MEPKELQAVHHHRYRLPGARLHDQVHQLLQEHQEQVYLVLLYGEMLSSSQGKNKQRRASQPRSPASTPTRVSASKHTKSSTITNKSRMSPTPEKARPGPELPPKCLIIETAYHAQKQLASTSAKPTDVAGNLTNPRPRNSAWKD